MVARIFVILVAMFFAHITTVSATDVLRVQALRSGDFTIDGKPGTMPLLQSEIARIKDANGTVWFYREGASSEPTEKQFEIFKVIVEARVPISLSTEPDFSNYVGPDGQLRPRK
jgi:hypothetical protein